MAPLGLGSHVKRPWDGKYGQARPGQFRARETVCNAMVWWLPERRCGQEVGPQQRRKWGMRVPHGHLALSPPGGASPTLPT